MLTKTDLSEALKPIIETLNSLKSEQSMISMRQRAQGMGIQTLQSELAQLDEKIDKRFNEQTATMAGFFHETWTALDKLENNPDERIHKTKTQRGTPKS